MAFESLADIPCFHVTLQARSGNAEWENRARNRGDGRIAQLVEHLPYKHKRAIFALPLERSKIGSKQDTAGDCGDFMFSQSFAVLRQFSPNRQSDRQSKVAAGIEITG